MRAPATREEAEAQLRALEDESVRLKTRLTEIPGERAALVGFAQAFRRLEAPRDRPRAFAQQAILAALRERGEVSAPELAASVVSTLGTAHATLSLLHRRGLIRRVGVGRYALPRDAEGADAEKRETVRAPTPADGSRPGALVVDYRALERLSGPAPKKPCPSCPEHPDVLAIGVADGHYIYRHARCATAFSSDGRIAVPR